MPELMQVTLIDQGLSLMLYGMGTVFVFLTILVFATTLMSRIVTKFAPDELPAVDTAPSSSVPSSLVLTVIEKAIQQHKNRA